MESKQYYHSGKWTLDGTLIFSERKATPVCAEVLNKESGERIVKCVNAHDELVENLTRIIDRIKENSWSELIPSAYDRAVECLKKVTDNTPINEKQKD